MNAFVAKLLSWTKIGKVVEPVQRFLSGKKAYLAGSALAVPAVVTILTKFSDQGLSYLLSVSSTPEWSAFLTGLGIMGLRAAVTKAADTEKDPNSPTQ